MPSWGFPASPEDLACVPAAAKAYRDKWASIRPPFPAEFDGTVADAHALDYMQYEGIGFPQGGVETAAMVCGEVLRRAAGLEWVISYRGDWFVASREEDWPAIAICPLARLHEIECGGVPIWSKLLVATEPAHVDESDSPCNRWLSLVALAVSLVASRGRAWRDPHQQGRHADARDARRAGFPVVGSPQEAVAPDVAEISLGVTVARPTVAEAVAINNKAMANLIEAITRGGVAAKDIQTSHISISPQYSEPAQSKPGVAPEATIPKVVAYEVGNTLRITVRNLLQDRRASGCGGQGGVESGVRGLLSDRRSRARDDGPANEGVRRRAEEGQRLRQAVGDGAGAGHRDQRIRHLVITAAARFHDALRRGPGTDVTDDAGERGGAGGQPFGLRRLRAEGGQVTRGPGRLPRTAGEERDAGCQTGQHSCCTPGCAAVLRARRARFDVALLGFWERARTIPV